MALFDFLATMNSTTMILFLLVFLLFVMSMKKALSIAWNAVWIAGISVIFPVVMNKLFDFSIPTDVDSLMSFMILGLGAYFIWLVASSVYKVLEEVEKVTSKIPKPTVPQIPHEGKHVEKETKSRNSDREKELDKREEELRKREEHVRWMSKLEQSKKSKKRNDDDDYAEMKD